MTQEYGADEYEPVHLDEVEPAPGEWSEGGGWSEPPWAGSGEWTNPPPRPQAEAPPSRSRWRSAQMLFRRRYNTAAIVTVGLVAGVLFLLAAIPMSNHGAAAGPMASAAAKPATNTVTFEAESPQNTLIGSATVGAYPGASGGQLVRAIGNWGSPRGLGALRFNDIEVVKSRFYVMTFYFVNIKAMATRTAVITVSGSKSVEVTVASNSACCTAQQLVVYLLKGTNSITFSNPTGQAPAIDKITIATG